MSSALAHVRLGRGEVAARPRDRALHPQRRDQLGRRAALPC